ncbi:DNA-processing protein DprA [Corynebacterium sp. H78]|uniref:DNA-processing protein DprA n=1 Tax=Corynebacterium sp. H78 TaxID=3133417 RepID=UPI0030A41F2F
MTNDSTFSKTERRALAYLNRVVEGPHRHLSALVHRVGIEDAAELIKRRINLTPELRSATESRHHFRQEDNDLDDAARLGFRIIAPGSPEWMPSLTNPFSVVDSCSLTEGPPVTLWVKGCSLDSLFVDSTAVVGTRAATRYGLTMTTKLAGELARRGTTIVSGGALGIDAAAHRAALDVGGRTVVFAACGAGVSYPAAHTELFQRIAGSGAIVSEYPPGMRPARHRFLTRNRLVAATSEATVLVEAGWRSGARNTATWALRMAKPLGAVPGPITSAASTGCHDLIRNQEATLVTSAENILALYRPVGSVDEDGLLELEWASTAVQKLSQPELKVYDSLPARGGADAHDVATAAGLPLGLAVHLLVALMKQGLVVRHGSRWERASMDSS